MTEQELNRVVQYVTAGTSHSKDIVAHILRTGFEEMTALSQHASCRFEREDLVGYICQWTMKKTGQPEPLVREILDCAGRWLDELGRSVPIGAPRKTDLADGEDTDAEAAS